MYTLVIGNKNYSSWSLRPWLLLSHFKIPFNEVQESLKRDNITANFGQYSASKRVPVLIDNNVNIWDSLAIAEYIAEKHPEHKMWPTESCDRAIARSLVCEMHSGFNALRNELPMNIRCRRKVEISENARKDIARIDAIFSQYSKNTENGLALFGEFGIADCFYAPVVSRLKTYGIEMSTKAQQYCDASLNRSAFLAWQLTACAETEIIEEDEAGIDI